jgi:NAD(P)H-dependent FMN reductase
VPKLLVVHHTPSPSLHSMLEAVLSGARDPRIEGVEVVVHPALEAVTPHVLEADGYLLGTPANLGYMSGALKHFFDLIYYPCLDATRGRPYGVYLHGNNDTDGALAAIQKIVTGLQWRQATTPVQVIGEPDRQALDRCWELGATLAASLTLDEP